MNIMESDATANPSSDLFTEFVQTLQQSLLPLTSAPSPSSTLGGAVSPMAQPATLSGMAEDCSRFLLQCSHISSLSYLAELYSVQEHYGKSSMTRPVVSSVTINPEISPLNRTRSLTLLCFSRGPH